MKRRESALILIIKVANIKKNIILHVNPYKTLENVHTKQTGKKRVGGGKREPQFSTINYSPPNSPRSGVTFQLKNTGETGDIYTVKTIKDPMVSIILCVAKQETNM